VIAADGHTIMKGFLGMTNKVVGGMPIPLVHSVHNTGRPNVKAVLVLTANYDYAVDQFGTLHQDLLAGVPEEYQDNVFVNNLEAGMTSGRRDTIHSSQCSHRADEIQQLYNPQDADDEPNPQKRFRPTVISYAVAARATTFMATQSSTITTAVVSASTPTTTQQSTNLSSLTDQDLDMLYDRLKHHVPVENDASPVISSEDMEHMVAECNHQIQQVREEMHQSVTELKEQVEVISASVKKQNGVILGLSKTLENTTIDLKNNINERVGALTAQISELRDLVQSLLPPSAPQAVAQLGGQGLQ